MQKYFYTTLNNIFIQITNIQIWSQMVMGKNGPIQRTDYWTARKRKKNDNPHTSICSSSSWVTGRFCEQKHQTQKENSWLLEVKERPSCNTTKQITIYFGAQLKVRNEWKPVPEDPQKRCYVIWKPIVTSISTFSHSGKTWSVWMWVYGSIYMTVLRKK